MKKITILVITLFAFACSNPMSKVYTEESFMEDMKEVRDAEGEETVAKISAYIMQQTFKNSFDKDSENKLVGKTYAELVEQADNLKAELKAKEEEEKRLAAEEELRKKKIQLKISESLTFAVTKKGYYEGQYGYPKNITYTFTFKNKTDKDIAGVKGTVIFYDMFDERIKSIGLSYDDGIKAGETENYKAQSSYTGYDSDEKKLKNTELSKLKVIWEPEQLIFSDGEKIVLD